GPPNDPALAKGFFIEPTVFADVTMSMRIAREEIFGPVLGVLKWSDEAKMLDEVNMVEYGLTCSIWTNDISTAHRTAAAVEAGFDLTADGGQAVFGGPFGASDYRIEHFFAIAAHPLVAACDSRIDAQHALTSAPTAPLALD